MPLVTSVELARVLDLESKRRVEQLVHEGMPRASRGRYDLGACMAWYIRFQKRTKRNGAEEAASGGSWNAERARSMRAEASLKEIELARKRGELISVDEAAKLWDEAVERMRAKMLASISSGAHRVVGLKSLGDANKALERLVFDALAAIAEVGDEIDGIGSNGKPR